ncbi:hypothetical protein AAFF_G00300930 [Aldrovandia affinis]|uniref:Uncharacterized protein n=1 Tax=Aldrovandia affinis TaxID=143900 RepID=A0AAD7SPT3_9TELE|nr:hypothetical protein AAFF_G00300930 [Aldrovandia affinis]
MEHLSSQIKEDCNELSVFTRDRAARTVTAGAEPKLSARPFQLLRCQRKSCRGWEGVGVPCQHSITSLAPGRLSSSTSRAHRRIPPHRLERLHGGAGLL